VGGDEFPSCVAVAYTSTAYIVQCGGAYREDNHCGTFIELHAAKTIHPDARGVARAKTPCDVDCNEVVLSQVNVTVK